MCAFAFFGDSLRLDTVMGAICKALRMGYALKSCNTLKMGAMGVHRDDLQYTCNENRYTDKEDTSLSHFLLEKEFCDMRSAEILEANKSTFSLFY